MWNPFKEAREARERAEKAEAMFAEIKHTLDAEKAIKQAIIDEANKLDKLLTEEKARKDAEKTKATNIGKPYFNIISVGLDGKEITEGEIELDWNQLFIDRLRKKGYQGVADEELVDQWFKDVCKHIVLESYEQADADISDNRVSKRKDLGDGTAEYT